MKLFEIHKNNKGYSVINCCGIKVKIKSKKHSQQPKSQHKFYSIFGNNNQIIIVENGFERTLRYKETIDGLNISISGNDNLVKLTKPFKFEGAKFIICSNHSSIIIEKTPRFMWQIKMVGGDNQSFTFGEGSDISYFGEVHLLDDNAAVSIGKDCMFAGQTSIWASDAHAVYDINTRKVLNKVSPPPKNCRPLLDCTRRQIHKKCKYCKKLCCCR